ncbi:MAG: NAD(+) synthase [Coriobacteriales bacterium]|jgi:NAD+ synthase (glutamine-hydrolysing)|nr:NAD(+) synthase [Coriobacteriales bacterium]
MYIAIVQNNPKVGAVKENVACALKSLEALAASPYPPDLVVFPAFALTGSPVEGLCFSDAFAAEVLDGAHSFIGKAPLPTLIGTLIPRPLEDVMGFISEPEALFCKEGAGGALGFVDIGNDWAPARYASSVTTVIDGHTISVLLDDYPEPEDDFSDSEIIILMLAKEYRGANTMFTASEQIGFLKDFARKNRAWVIVANLVGAQDATVYDGASLVMRPNGTIAEAGGSFVTQTITCNLKLDEALQAFETPTVSTASRGQNLGRQAADNRLVKPLLPYEADWKALKLCLGDYVAKNGFTEVVLGLSGGIDSALTATLAVDALGSEHVHGVLMPGPHSSKGSIDDATALAHNLGIETLTMPITRPLDAFDELSQEVLGQKGSPVAQQNIQARIRTLYLMHLSNTFGWLVLNTGNKSEAAMGYSTLYGDTAGALAPLGNIYKSDVYGLAFWRNEKVVVIPVEILEKEPSAELYDGQKDEDSLPPYELLDRILRLHLEDGFGVDQILEYLQQEPDGERFPAALVERILNTVRGAEYKRRQEPLAPSLGYLDMSADRVWPLTNGFHDHHRDLKPDIGLMDYLGMIRGWRQPEGWDFLAN